MAARAAASSRQDTKSNVEDLPLPHITCRFLWREPIRSPEAPCGIEPYHLLINHTRSVDLWPSGTKCTRDLPVSHVVWHNTNMGGIMLYHMAGKFEKRTVYERQFSTCGIPKSVRMEMSPTSSNDSRQCKRKSLKFWSKNVFQKKRRGHQKQIRTGRWARAYTEITHWTWSSNSSLFTIRWASSSTDHRNIPFNALWW